MAPEKDETHATTVLPPTPSPTPCPKCGATTRVCCCGIPSVPEAGHDGACPHSLLRAVNKARVFRRTIDLPGILPIPRIDCLLWRLLVLTEKLVKDMKDFCAFEGLLLGYLESYLVPTPWRSFRGREHKRDLEVLAHMQWHCPDLPDAEGFQVDLTSPPWQMRFQVLRYLLAISVYIANSYDVGRAMLFHTFRAPKSIPTYAGFNRATLAIKIGTDVVEECPICLQEIRESRDLPTAMYATTGCGHRFHQTCFKTWTEIAPEIAPHTTCPSCRTPML